MMKVALPLILTSTYLLVGCADDSAEEAAAEQETSMAETIEAPAEETDDSLLSPVEQSAPDEPITPDTTSLGEFDAAEVVLVDDERVTSPAVRADGLEMYYVKGESKAESFHVASRAEDSGAFTPGPAVDELNALCAVDEDRSIDISDDGLRAYITCYEEISEPARLYEVERGDLSLAFGDALEVATLPTSTSLSPDELTLVTAPYGSGATLTATRESIGSSFEEPTVLPGLENVNLFAPVLSADGLEIYGATAGQFSSATRSSVNASFGELIDLSFLLPEEVRVAGAPELSADERTLYFVGVTIDSEYAIYAASR
ncbi:MAG: hypothetical protein MK135_01270 [Polyangiaceae bacterium]|nr:hypothetical protein [Polyangiaceae bacterium]